MYFGVPVEVNATRCRFTNLMSDFPPLPQRGCVCKVNGGKSAFSLLMFLRQMGTMWMTGLVQKFTSLRKMGMDSFARTFSVLKSCMLLSKRRRFSV